MNDKNSLFDRMRKLFCVLRKIVPPGKMRCSKDKF